MNKRLFYRFDADRLALRGLSSADQWEKNNPQFQNPQFAGTWLCTGEDADGARERMLIDMGVSDSEVRG